MKNCGKKLYFFIFATDYCKQFIDCELSEEAISHVHERVVTAFVDNY